MQARTLIPAIVAVVLTGASAQAQTPTLIGTNNDWQTYSYGGAKGKVCYALSKPTRLEPSDRNHGDVFFFISNRPGENVANEPSVIVGYAFREQSSVSIDVDGKAFTMFTKNDGAWMANPTEERQLVAAMRAGRSMTVKGVSSRGTQTSYTFSLSGVTAAINAADTACR